MAAPGRVASRIYVTGAPCAGVTRLGRALAQRRDLAHVDVDDFGWDRMDPSFPRDRQKCIDRIRRSLPSDRWVLTGPVEGWGDVLLAGVDLIGFVVAPTSVRLQRLVARDRDRHGDLHEAHMAAYRRASRYDDPTFRGPNRLGQEQWLLARDAPVVRLDGTLPTDDAADRLLTGVRRRAGP